MTKQETIKIMRVLSANYKSYFEKLSNEELEMLTLTYDFTFRNYQFEDVQRAVLSYIRTNRFNYPNIAEINLILAPNVYIDYDDMFNIAWKNLSSNRNRAKENWENLNDIQKEYISVDLLVRLGKSMESDKQYIRKDLISEWKNKTQNINNSLLNGDNKYLTYVKEQKLIGESNGNNI